MIRRSVGQWLQASGHEIGDDEFYAGHPLDVDEIDFRIEYLELPQLRVLLKDVPALLLTISTIWSPIE